MSYLNNLLTGMESYLEGDVDTEASTSTDAEIAESRAEAAEVEADTIEAVKDAQETETATMLLDRMCTMYQHVKQFGIDRTFVSLYNRHGELDRVCGMSFPSCESMDAVGDRYSRYSQAFIAAMEDGKEGLWAKIKGIFGKIWNWIKGVVSSIWAKITSLFAKKKTTVQKLAAAMATAKDKIANFKDNIPAPVAALFGFLMNHKEKIAQLTSAAMTFIAAVKSHNLAEQREHAAKIQKMTAKLKRELTDDEKSEITGEKKKYGIMEIGKIVWDVVAAYKNVGKLLDDTSSLGTKVKSGMAVLGKTIDSAAKIGGTDLSKADPNTLSSLMQAGQQIVKYTTGFRGFIVNRFASYTAWLGSLLFRKSPAPQE